MKVSQEERAFAIKFEQEVRSIIRAAGAAFEGQLMTDDLVTKYHAMLTIAFTDVGLPFDIVRTQDGFSVSISPANLGKAARKHFLCRGPVYERVLH